MDSDHFDHFINTCKNNQLKVTPQRMAIFEEIARSKSHPSADEVFKKIRKVFPSISFDTVNRTLLTFYSVGIVDVVEGKGVPRRFDSNLETHHHFHCIKCDHIWDFFNEDYDALKIPETIQKKFTILNKRVVLNGICAKCEESRTTAGASSKEKALTDWKPTPPKPS